MRSPLSVKLRWVIGWTETGRDSNRKSIGPGGSRFLSIDEGDESIVVNVDSVSKSNDQNGDDRKTQAGSNSNRKRRDLETEVANDQSSSLLFYLLK